MIKNYFIIVFAFVLLSLQSVFSQNTTWFVSQNGNGNGTSWNLSSNNLQTVIDNAAPGDQVWIKQGTYQRALGLSFSIKNGVSVYGGFPSTGNPTQSDRNPNLYETILLGNQARVLEAFGVFEPINSSTIIDGLTIKNGYSTSGAGLSISFCDATFRNLKIIDNVASIGLGAGMNIFNSNSAFIQVLVSNNTSNLTPGNDGDAAGIRITGGATSFYNCIIADNHAEGYIGGLWLASNTTCHFYNGIIYGNTAGLQYETSNNDNYYAQNNVNFYASNCILEDCKGSDSLFGTPQFAVYGIDMGKNFDVDPLFNSDYSLQPTSIGVNKGSTAAYQAAINAVTKDFFNNNRIVDAIDIGLSEFQTPQSEVLYVRENATGNGSSWANASGDLQLIMDKQFEGKQVWVAAGTYFAPDSYFKLRESVKVYGGFPTTGNPTFDDRDAEVYPTKLTSTSFGIIGNFYTANKKISAETLLDGFVITKSQNSPVDMFGIHEMYSDVTYSDVTFTELTSSPVQVFYDSKNTFVDCKFIDNSCTLLDETATIIMHSGADVAFTRCSFIENLSFQSSAMRLQNNSNVIIDECLFKDNSTIGATGFGKVISVINSSATIKKSIFDGNGNSEVGGCIVSIFGIPDSFMPEWTHPVNVSVDRCIFKNNNNSAVSHQLKASDVVSITNSLFFKNTGSVGGAVRNEGNGNLYVTNCTLTENHAQSQGGGAVYLGEGTGTTHFRNAIIYNNSSVYPDIPEIWAFHSLTFKNSIIRTSGGSPNWDGGAFNNFNLPDLSTDLGGNLDVNPLFVDAANEDYRLSAESPAINAGNNVFFAPGNIPELAALTMDLGGNNRILDNTIDIGTYEFEPLLGNSLFELAKGISVYPNPTEGWVQIRSVDAEIKEVKVYSLLGKELMTVQNEILNITDLSAGIYIVKVVLGDSKTYSVKLIRK